MCHVIFGSFLPTLEGLHESDGFTRPALERHKQDMLGVGQIWDLEAMAFNMPFTNINSIVERLRATNIHEIFRRDAQFIVGVYVHPIVHRFFSVLLNVHCRLFTLKFSGLRKILRRYGSTMEQYAHNLQVEPSIVIYCSTEFLQLSK